MGLVWNDKTRTKKPVAGVGGTVGDMSIYQRPLFFLGGYQDLNPGVLVHWTISPVLFKVFWDRALLSCREDHYLLLVPKIQLWTTNKTGKEKTVKQSTCTLAASLQVSCQPQVTLQLFARVLSTTGLAAVSLPHLHLGTLFFSLLYIIRNFIVFRKRSTIQFHLKQNQTSQGRTYYIITSL